MGFEDTLKSFLKGKFVQKGSSETCFDHGQFEIKIFPITPRPKCTETSCVNQISVINIYYY